MARYTLFLLGFLCLLLALPAKADQGMHGAAESLRALASTEPSSSDYVTRVDEALAALSPVAQEGDVQALTLQVQLLETLANAGKYDEARARLDTVEADLRAAISRPEAALFSSLSTLLRDLKLAEAEWIQAQIEMGTLSPSEGQQALAMALSQALDASDALIEDDDPSARSLVAQLKALQTDGSPQQITLQQRLEAMDNREAREKLATLGAPEEIAEARFERINVFYGTSRARTGREGPRGIYNDQRGEALEYGAVTITLPKKRALGAVPRPIFGDPRGARDGFHVVIKSIRTIDDQSRFQSDFREHLNKADQPRREAFIYIHGHGDDFDVAARRTAQLAVDLDMRAGAVLYSWPAGNPITGYSVSRNNARSAANGLVELISATSAEVDTLHLIAHSLGNRTLLDALILLEDQNGVTNVGEVIWAAPDEDASVFAREVSALPETIRERMTLYVSARDSALGLSRILGGDYPRAGEAPPLPALTTAIHTVDTSDASRLRAYDPLNHADYVGAAINDLRAVVWFSLTPDSRCILQSRPDGSAPYWSLVAESGTCSDQNFRRALSARRLYGDRAESEITALIGLLKETNDLENLQSWQAALTILSEIPTQ